jgi:hypothetical protein
MDSYNQIILIPLLRSISTGHSQAQWIWNTVFGDKNAFLSYWFLQEAFSYIIYVYFTIAYVY